MARTSIETEEKGRKQDSSGGILSLSYLMDKKEFGSRSLEFWGEAQAGDVILGVLRVVIPQDSMRWFRKQVLIEGKVKD